MDAVCGRRGSCTGGLVLGSSQDVLRQLDEPLAEVGQVPVPAVAHHQLADGGGVGEGKEVQGVGGGAGGGHVDGL